MLPQTQGETITTTAKTGQVRSLEWTGSRLRVLDQRLLPTRVEYAELERWQDVVSAIQSMQVRGAPAIGVAGAYGVVLAARALRDLAVPAFREELAEAAEQLAAARPTAVNLPWAVARTLRAADGAADAADAVERTLREAQAIEAEDLQANMAIGAYGAALLPQGARVLTHCNTGALATAGYGTALGVVRAAWEQGVLAGVVATETRPLLQGARLDGVGADARKASPRRSSSTARRRPCCATTASLRWSLGRTASPPTVTWRTRSARTG